MKHTYLLIAALSRSPAPYWTYLKSPQKKKTFDTDCTTSYVLYSGATESNLIQISTRCKDVIADYSVEIKIAIFQAISECQSDEWR